MTVVNQDFLTDKVQRILNKYPYGLTFSCYLELKHATEISNVEIARHFGISMTSFDAFKKAHEKVIYEKGIK